MVAYAGCAGNAAEARKAREARVEFGLRQIAVAGALASAAVLAAAGHTAFAGGAAVLGMAVFFAQKPELTDYAEAIRDETVQTPRFMP